MSDLVEKLRETYCNDTCWSRRNDAADEVERLRAGGCARDQATTQFCAEAVELQKDAERYRWLRSNRHQSTVIYHRGFELWDRRRNITPEDAFDAAIDAARAADSAGEKP